MAARRRRGEEEDLSEGEEVESKEAEAISDTEGKAGLVDSASEVRDRINLSLTKVTSGLN